MGTSESLDPHKHQSHFLEKRSGLDLQGRSFNFFGNTGVAVCMVPCVLRMHVLLYSRLRDLIVPLALGERVKEFSEKGLISCLFL
jgi:hypothetical protein